MLLRRIAVALVFCGFTFAAFGVQAKKKSSALAVGTVSATAPKKWKGAIADGNLVFVPTKAVKGGTLDEISILVSEGAAPAASGAALIEQTWNAFSAGMTIKGRKAGPVSKTAKGLDLALSFGEAAADGESASLVIGALTRPGGQAVVVVFMKNDAVFGRHADAIGALLNSIEIKGGTNSAASVATAGGAAVANSAAEVAPSNAAGAFPAPQAIAGMGKGVAGTWALLRTGARASHSSMTGVDLGAQWDVFVLLPDGRYSSRLHPQGLNQKSASDLTAVFPSYWGTYKVSGKALTLTTSNGIASTYSLKGAVLVPTEPTSGSDMVRADTGANRRIAGTFARHNITTKTFGNRLPTLTFALDGTFVDAHEGVYTVHSGPWDAVNWTDADYAKYRAAGRGTYRIHHNSLYLLYADGRKKVMHVAILPTGGSEAEPRGIYVGDHWMTRR